MRLSTDDQIQREAERLIRAGWVMLPGRRHTKLRAPDNRVFPIPGTPSDHRSAQNWIHWVRRHERALTTTEP